MTNRIDALFSEARANGRSVLSPYVTIGFPDVATSVDMAEALLNAGGDMLELGVPFSDPLADGPTVQRTSYLALQNGVTVKTCLEAVRTLRSRGVSAPLLLMGYYNPFLHYGPERFIADADAAGVDGLIVPDLPFEESEQFEKLCEANGLHMVQFVSLTSTDERIARVAKTARGFIYCVAVLGVTGARAEVRSDVRDLVKRIRQRTDVPVIQGFGVSRREHLETIAEYADGAIIASAYLDAVDKAPRDQAVQTAVEFIRNLKSNQQEI